MRWRWILLLVDYMHICWPQRNNETWGILRFMSGSGRWGERTPCSIPFSPSFIPSSLLIQTVPNMSVPLLFPHSSPIRLTNTVLVSISKTSDPVSYSESWSTSSYSSACANIAFQRKDAIFDKNTLLLKACSQKWLNQFDWNEEKKNSHTIFSQKLIWTMESFCLNRWSVAKI